MAIKLGKTDQSSDLCVTFLSRMCPIFQISNVTGENMDLLKMFLNLLSSRTAYRDDQPAEFQIDDTYSVPVRTHSTCKLGLLKMPVKFWVDCA